VLVGSVVDDQVEHDAHAALVGGIEQLREVPERAQPRVDAVEIGHVVPVVAPQRGMHRLSHRHVTPSRAK
jgi:hypothetical protein